MIIDETVKTSNIDDVEMNYRQDDEQFYDCYDYEENQGEYLEEVQYIQVKKCKEHRRNGGVESNVSHNMRVYKMSSPELKNTASENSLEHSLEGV
jgi:hypothetical protein